MKKILSVFFFLSTFYFLLAAYASPALAAFENPNSPKTGGAWFVQDPATWQATTFGGDPAQMDANKYGVFMVTNLANTIIAATGGVQTLAYDQNGKPYYTYQGGATSFLAGLVGNLYTTPPASSVEYLADLGSTLGLVKPAYAQGIGFAALSPLLTLWKVFRDLAYLFFVVIFVVVGMMVMFRKKIDPRTVVTVQEALPHLVLALILITFSYAIIGLMVDFMNLSSIVIMQIFYPNNVFSLTQINSFLFSNNIMVLIWGFHGAVASLGKIVGENVKVTLVGSLGEVSAQIVFNVGLFFLMFKVFFMLLGSYVAIVLGVILAPFQILLKTLPGEKNNLLSFLSDLLANILVFPATLIMLLIAFKFIHDGVLEPGHFNDTPWKDMSTGSIMGGGSGVLSWAPPLMGFTQGLGIFIGYGILMAIPAVGNTIKEAFQIKGSAMAGEAEKGIRGGLSWVPFIGGMAR